MQLFKYGLEKAQEMLNTITNEAIKIADTYSNGAFLKELALYIANRNK